MILHTLNATPASQAFRDCLQVIAAGDALLLLGDGVYAAQVESAACNALLASGATVHLLRADAAATGVAAHERIESVDMDGFVALSEQFPRQQAWY